MENNRIRRYVDRGTLIMLMLTGFAQMPIFKRYYIADIFGFGWLAQFYVTHLLHYFFAAVFIGIAFYRLVLYVGNNKSYPPLGFSQKLTALSVAVLIVTGFVLVIKNFTVHWFSPGMISVMLVVHLMFVLILAAALLSAFFQQKRLEKRRVTYE